MGQIDLSGSLTAGPPSAGSGFPSASEVIGLQLLSSPKSSGVATGALVRTIAVADPTWLALSGVGATDTVTKCDTLVVRCTSSLLFRLTTDDGAGGDVVSIVPIQGLLLLEFPADKFLKLLEVQGTGQLQYFVSGQS